MRVLFQSHHDLGRMYGGGPSVAFNLASALEKLGIEVIFHDYWKHNPKQFDIVHYFSMMDSFNWLHHAADDPPLVVTPITWYDFSRWMRFEKEAKFWLRALRHRTTNRRRLGYPEAVPNHWFPNSEGEAKHLQTWLNLPRDRMSIVPHGVHRRFAEGDGKEFEAKFGLRDFALCVGRFEYPRKNQLRLVEAMRNSQVPLVFIGGPDKQHGWYYEQCRAAAGPRTTFLPPMNHDDPLLRSAYHACKVIVQPALLESPGLAGLEGALGGANVATTEGGSTREHYADLAWYFDPCSTEEIRKAVEAAHAAPRTERMKERALTLYTWDRIAEVQAEAYRQVLAKERR